MSSIELFFLNAGMSYWLSKLLAYLFFPFIGLVIWFILKRRVKKRVWKLVTLLVLILLPFFAYFMVYPIYEGDFSNRSVQVTQASELDSLQADKLIVISIPDCPFCRESVGRMLAMKERHPNVEIEYRVCANDSMVEEAVASYKAIAGNKIKVTASHDERKLAGMAEMSFPTFVLVTKSKKVKWSNDNFGVGALDEVVDHFEK